MLRCYYYRKMFVKCACMVMQNLCKIFADEIVENLMIDLPLQYALRTTDMEAIIYILLTVSDCLPETNLQL